jgi:hypothetical protein
MDGYDAFSARGYLILYKISINIIGGQIAIYRNYSGAYMGYGQPGGYVGMGGYDYLIACPYA